ncbi:MAG: prolyl oligopeptidase family serine peptidase [Anaerolineales bacterium]|nr:prolyl oligopeptidase family serine peptidase [Anaerolineales bacterium]
MTAFLRAGDFVDAACQSSSDPWPGSEQSIGRVPTARVGRAIGELTQLTDWPEGKLFGVLLPDGRYRLLSGLDHGFAHLTINYHGSTTFGREFQGQIWGNPGHWEAEDMVAARAWLVQEGIARPDQILLIGPSYGGYLTLQTPGKRPDLWAGGMASIAIADWAMQYDDSTDMGKGHIIALFGGTPGERPEQYAASSPTTYVENVKAPVLIIQGRNDTRAPARQIGMYEGKMNSLGKSIEVHWFDAGHMGRLAQVEQSIKHQEIMLRFAYRILS